MTIDHRELADAFVDAAERAPSGLLSDVFTRLYEAFGGVVSLTGQPTSSTTETKQ